MNVDPKKFLDSNNEVHCGECKKPLWKYDGSLVIGEAMRANAFHPITKDVPIPVNGEKIRYCFCGAEYSWLKQAWYCPADFKRAGKYDE